MREAFVCRWLLVFLWNARKTSWVLMFWSELRSMRSTLPSHQYPRGFSCNTEECKEPSTDKSLTHMNVYSLYIVGKVMSLLFNMLSSLVIAFLPRSKCILISWLQSPSAVILKLPKINSVSVSIVYESICHEVMGLDAMIFVSWMLSFKSAFSPSSRGSLFPLSFLPFGWPGSKCKSRGDVVILLRSTNRQRWN